MCACEEEQEEREEEEDVGNEQESIQQMEASLRNGAEGEEEHIMFLRRGYHVRKDANTNTDDIKNIDSAENLLHMLLKGRFMCLVGPPASGKTVTMFQIAFAAAAAMQQCVDGDFPQGALPPRIPLFMRAVELSALLTEKTRDFSQIDSLETLVKLHISHKFAKNPSIVRVLHEFFELRRVLLIIDGLDEAAAHRSMIEDCVDKAAEDNDICLMISTRDYALQASHMEDRLYAFETVKIPPLDEKRRSLLIGRRLPESQEALNFCSQLAAVALQTPEMATSPFLLALMIEVFKKDENHEIPSKRSQLYDRQVNNILVRHKPFRHIVTRPGSVKSLLDTVAHMIYHDTTHGLYRKARLNPEGFHALRQSLLSDCQGDNEDVGTASLALVREFLQLLAFVCQMRIEKRDFRWDSEDLQEHMQKLWQHSDTPLEGVSRFALDLSLVGLISRVGDGEFRFSHLTLQEYLAAEYTFQLCRDDAPRLFHELQPLRSRWKREVLKFTTGMLDPSIFVELCQLVLKSDDEGTGEHCELVQDLIENFVKEHAFLFKEQLLLEKPDQIYRALLVLCVDSNEKVRNCALVSLCVYVAHAYFLMEVGSVCA